MADLLETRYDQKIRSACGTFYYDNYDIIGLVLICNV
jgi:hypothetical protein